MPGFTDLWIVNTLSATKQFVIDTAVAANLRVTSWIFGDPSERWVDISARLVNSFEGQIVNAIRGFFLDLATDPGDVASDGRADQSADQTPRAGFLSALGAGWYGTIRGEARFATGFVTVHNTGAVPADFAPFDLTFQRSTAASDGNKPTYRNTTAPLIYVNFDGTVTIGPGASKTIPVIAEQRGTVANAAPGEINIAVTQNFAATVTNDSPVLGSDREGRAAYVERCKGAADQQSPGGPRAAYIRGANTALGGAILARFDGSGDVGITRVYASPESATGNVDVYYAGLSGAAEAVDTASANANLFGIPLGVITAPIGVVPDTVTLGPGIALVVSDATNTSPIEITTSVAYVIATGSQVSIAGVGGNTAANGTWTVTWIGGSTFSLVGSTGNGAYTSGGAVTIPGGVPATETLITVNLTYKIKARSGGLQGAALTTAASAAINTALSDGFEAFDIGGVDQVLGAGVIYTVDLQGIARDAYPGIYDLVVTTPATASTAILLGHVATYAGGTRTGTVT